MDIKWSEEQKKAIYTQDKNIIVSASAGAGKTMVLIGRLMHLICDLHYSIDEILAMTFSEAAANEMKKRLSKNLQEELTKNPEDKFIYQQLVKINDANISTIHGFCLNIIKEYYYVINLDKSRINNILDENTCSLLKQQAVNKVLNNYYDLAEFEQLSVIFDQSPLNNKNLIEAIYSLAEMANSQKNPISFLSEVSNKYYLINNLKELNSVVYNNFIEFFFMNTQIYKELIIEYANEYEKELSEEIFDLDKCLEFLKHDDYEQYRLLFISIIKRIKLVKTKAKEADEIETKILNNLYEEQSFIKFHNELVPLVALLCNITEEYLKIYDELKQENDGIDFSDMEHLAMKILEANDNYVANIYKERFKTIMVDEFQDTNDAQNELVNLISRGNNVFRVGDIKQSIYGFRYAMPKIMKNLVDYPSEQDEVVFLSSNYRSGKSIVDFNNYLYTKLMNLDDISCEYSEHDNVNCGSARQAEYNYPIKLHLLDEKNIKQANEKVSNDEIKSEYVVTLIQKALNEGYQYKDIAILTRGNGSMYDIKKILDKYNIPAFFTKKRGLFDSVGIQNIISTLHALVNPYDNLNFIAMLTSPLVGMSHEQIAEMKLSMEDNIYYNYCEKNYSNIIANFINLQENLLKKDALEIINDILLWNNYYEQHLDDQERANVDYLCEKIADLENQKDISITGLVAKLDEWSELDNGEAMSVGQNDDVVKIMTIHASKGLEYKVVIMYQKDNLVQKANSSCAYFDDELGIGVDYYADQVKYPTIEKIAYNQKNIRIYLEEELRLLYVATTRPEHQLHIVDFDRELSANEYNLVSFYRARGYSDWIRLAMKFAPKELFSVDHIEMLEDNTVFEDEVVYNYDLSKYNVEIDDESETILPPSYHQDEIKSFEEYSTKGLLFGSTVHKLIELLPNEVWDEKIIKDNALNNMQVSQYIIDKLLNLNKNEHFNKLRKSNQVIKELPFMLKYQNDIISGYMDYVAIENDTVTVIDFKTDAINDEKELINKYQRQLDIYEMALKKLYKNKVIKKYIYSFKLDRMIEIC